MRKLNYEKFLSYNSSNVIFIDETLNNFLIKVNIWIFILNFMIIIKNLK